MRRWLRHFLPYGLVRSLQMADELIRIGVPPTHARKLAKTRKTAVRMNNLNFDLLPDGALKDIGWVVDVGANEGEWTDDLLTICNPKHVICIEPDPNLAPKLKTRFAATPSVEICQFALGAAMGVSKFNLMKNTVLNSLRTPDPEMLKLNPTPFEISSTVTVQVRPLDSVLPSDQPIQLLKIDAQGFEREVLSGATQTLARTQFVLLEVNFQPHYQGEADFFELTTIMRRHGFEIGNYSEPKGGLREALYADVLYLKSER
jgi:FkbM family methyltransferase